jgi:hypothetical protein
MQNHRERRPGGSVRVWLGDERNHDDVSLKVQEVHHAEGDYGLPVAQRDR